MTQTETLDKLLDDALFIPISWIKGRKGGSDYREDEIYISGTSRDELIAGIKRACKEAGLIFKHCYAGTGVDIYCVEEEIEL